MNKVTTVMCALVAAAIATPLAAAPYKMAGCGLGSMVIGSDGFVQIFAATTNGTSANQTFAITSGTSGCVRDGVVLASREQEAFVEANFDNVQQDIAAGDGEHLASLLELFSCSEEVRPQATKVAQANYGVVFSGKDTSPVQALYTLKVMLSQDPAVAAACQL